ncbi:hypothetical protein LFX25_07200 [Leptospira sp. FAT2]|uniref:hypothetical protein n=1 Tax=Leptospira sanjuanensis TaxID=2879643 RepID=UPI001EE7E1F9|nr:hypothetical protein [Leptospira sanjuanensis]MCG6167608.1 hypothetical protein [Leptospira sanjuanensis]MCG6193027.1 hypothetical protein [Leptospira sanjuanensis]
MIKIFSISFLYKLKKSFEKIRNYFYRFIIKYKLPIKIHPIYIYYPHHFDYSGMLEFRPFVMMMHEANFRSKAINTDEFGLREQYFKKTGEFLKIRQLKRDLDHCNLITGGSTVFGTNASSDKETIAYHLSTDVPFINFGIRGGTSQQEVIEFLLLKKFLPTLKNIVLLSGINNFSLASINAPIQFPEFGSTFYQDIFFGKDFIVSKNRKIPKQNFKRKLEILTSILLNDLDTWKGLQTSGNSKVHYVLQPVVGWTQKKLTHLEKLCIDADIKIFGKLHEIYWDQELYVEYSQTIRNACELYGIEFHDSNEWLNDPRFENETVFTDICHLTDHGNLILAELLSKKLKWVN